ncbi:Microphthalmia-associated transcription factor, partial [Frankliniella fusca]
MRTSEAAPCPPPLLPQQFYPQLQLQPPLPPPLHQPPQPLQQPPFDPAALSKHELRGEQLLLLQQMQALQQQGRQQDALQDSQQDLGDMIEKLILQGADSPRSIRVHVGIDEDLRMILDMDPSIVDMVPAVAPVEAPPAAPPQPTSPRASRLPPRGPPSFKHSSVPLRTQMKQQLMREQQMQQERLEREQRLQMQMQQLQQQQRQAAAPPRPPVNIGVDVPQSVFQVQTVLENPTKYHVLERSKSQVRQYVQASLQQSQQLVEDAVLPRPPPETTAGEEPGRALGTPVLSRLAGTLSGTLSGVGVPGPDAPAPQEQQQQQQQCDTTVSSTVSSSVCSGRSAASAAASASATSASE